MKKFWIVYSIKNNGSFERYDSYEGAEEAAKRLAFDNRNNEYIIMEAVASTKLPVPEIDVVAILDE